MYGLEEAKREDDKTTPTIWIDKRNVEESLDAIQELGYRYVHIQTFQLDFLSDNRLKDIKGLSIQHYIDDLTPFYDFNLSQLTHLGLPDGIQAEFDFAICPNLISLKGRIPKFYKNFEQLTELKYVRIFGYRKENFREFSRLNSLKKIEAFSIYCVDLSGLGNLKQLSELALDGCPRLESLDGVGVKNELLEKVRIVNCKRLADFSNLTKLSSLKILSLHNIYKLDSFNFLDKLDSLQDLSVHPSYVGVTKDNYYPLLDKLKELGQLPQLEYWERLEDYLNGKVIIEDKEEEQPSELRLVLSKSPILNWVRYEEDEYYWDIYSAENCDEAQQILVRLVDQLEANKSLTEPQKIDLFKACILELNEYNGKTGGGFIETVEREELCDFFDNLADAAGIDVLSIADGYAMGIADEWREW
ncbi:MAG: hypothetical protein AAF806_22650 [Bacteroidota bacterium]